MFYVYILKSESPKSNEANAHYYVGITSNLKRRFDEHNRGASIYTNQYRPWRLINYIAFLSKKRAEKFEYYLKSGAGRRFQLRHFGE